MKGCLSSITCHVGVSSIAEEQVDQDAVTVEGGVVERGETTPAWTEINTYTPQSGSEMLICSHWDQQHQPDVDAQWVCGWMVKTL